MSDSETLSLNHLPLEILHSVFHYLDIPDILGIRRVNRYLNQVSHSKHVWSDVYRKAEFICPPGPFLSRSAHDLEKALVSSFRVDRNLRHGGSTQTERSTLKVREIRYTGVDLRVRLVFGRFLLVAFKEEVRCYDLNLDTSDSNSGASIIYRTTGASLRSFDCVSAVDAEGRSFACAVLNEITKTAARISIYSLNVGEQSEVTLDLLHQFERGAFNCIDTVDLGPRVIVVNVGGRVIEGGWHHVVLDVHTHTQFMLSSFVSDIKWDSEVASELPNWNAVEEFTSPTSISTSTHVLVAVSFYTRAAGWSTFFQAFSLPPPHTHRYSIPASTPLSLSHRGLIPGINLPEIVLLHDAILDSTTQDVVIAIRVHAFESSRPRSPLSKHGILRLSAVQPPGDHEVGTITFRLLSPIGHPRAFFLHPSFNGTGRAFYTLEPGSHGIVSALEYDLRTRGYDDGEQEAKVVEYPSILRFPTPRTLLDYDPYAGRICLRSTMTKYSVIEILDLAV
ncbi:hypothetical protein L210DRAFT_3641060 [Boletus edulis BED1]|uniref:F-box domain-containing protein n=1 Tax=Boletus edulis BED1 TaxID=1328754 RepID=A0AAD4GCK8_BOLED|nr:hypothetical protein L210DRAFT_3631713 [Boletus edulis BED1]KAF8449466.1 hypothetical protein L210DRAFT_3641060 [Boletus edulis BED1]